MINTEYITRLRLNYSDIVYKLEIYRMITYYLITRLKKLFSAIFRPSPNI